MHLPHFAIILRSSINLLVISAYVRDKEELGEFKNIIKKFLNH